MLQAFKPLSVLLDSMLTRIVMCRITQQTGTSSRLLLTLSLYCNDGAVGQGKQKRHRAVTVKTCQLPVPVMSIEDEPMKSTALSHLG